MLTIKYLPEIAAFLIFIMMSIQASTIGPILVLCQLGLVGLLLLLHWKVFVEVMVRWWPLLLLPLVATLSAFWSILPMVSLRYGLQLLLTAVIGVVLARLLSPRRFVIVLVLSMFVFLILCILDGTKGQSANGWVLIGLTGSKNQIAYVGLTVLLSALTVAMLRDVKPLVRWAAFLCLPLALFILAGANAATALVLAVVGAALVLGLAFLQRVPRSGRFAVIVATVVILTPLAFVIPELLAGVDYFVSETLNKDPTLTGRTLLWERADDLIARRPLLGHGYKAIWLGEGVDTVALQRITGIMDGRTFNFHQSYRDIGVDLGALGFMVFTLTLLAASASFFFRLIVSPSLPMNFFAVFFFTMVARTFTENIIGPFSLNTVLFFAAATYAFSALQTASAEQRPLLAGFPRFGFAGAQRSNLRNR